MNVLVSIIIPCYNAEPWIGECLNSVIAQTYRPLEIIVIDDGSTDGSLDVIKRYAQQYPDLIQYETGPNRGGCAARNRGFALSKGEYVLFMDADDTMEPETVAGQMERMAGRTDIIVSSPWWVMQWMGDRWQRFDHQYAQGDDPLVGELRYGDYIPLPALLWPHAVIDALGGWDETLWANQDGDLRLRARLARYVIVPSQRGGFVYRRHSQHTVSSSPSYRALESRIRVYEKVEQTLAASGRLKLYQRDLAYAFHSIASGIMPLNEELGDRALRHAVRLGGIRSVHGTLQHRLLCYTIGLKRKERLARWMMKGYLSRVLGRSQTQKLTSQIEAAPRSSAVFPSSETYV